MSRALQADVRGAEPPAAELHRLAALATAAPAGTRSAAPWWRHGAAVTVVGVVLAGGVGASYAAGVIEPPWSPSDHQPLDPDPVPTTPAPGQRSDSTDVPGAGPTGADQASDGPGPDSTPGQQHGRSSEAPGRTGTAPPGAPLTDLPPDTTPGEGTGKGRGHGPGGDPDHAQPTPERPERDFNGPADVDLPDRGVRDPELVPGSSADDKRRDRM